MRAGNRPLSKMDQAYVDSLAAERTGVKPATLVRQIYTPVAAVMNCAAESALCNPVRFRKPKIRNARLDWLTPAQVETLLGFLPDYLRRLVTFYVATGCRATEAVDLIWQDISPEGLKAVLWETKGDYARSVDLQKRAREALPERTEGRVFLNSRGEPWHGYDAVNLMLKRHCAKNGFRPVHCHLFRHTWATWAYAVTRDMTFLMGQGGWKSATMVMRYAHPASDDLARAVRAAGWEIRGRSKK
jgi:integrase